MNGIKFNPMAQITAESLPPKFRPLSPWSYFGLTILFSLPIVGLVFLIIFSFNQNNINRRNFARSYFCALIVVLIMAVILFVIGMITGLTAEIFSKFN